VAGYMFDWARCGRERFEAIVESLLVNKHETEHTGHAQAVDGRGGDGGIDVDVTLDDGTLDTIYQLKYFPEGLSGNYKDTRRRQIRGSYVTAMKHSPKRWVLVVPCNLTPKEGSWLRSLAGKRGVVPTWMGVTELEVELARAPHIYRHFTADALREALQIAGNERALLQTPQEIDAAVTSVASRLSALSVFWNVDAHVGADGAVHRTITARRLDAGEKEPLGLAFGVRADDQRAHEAVESFRSGSPDLVLEPDQVVALHFEGPPWFAEDLTGSGLRLSREVPSRVHPVEVRLSDEAGSSLAALDGTISGRRAQGGSLDLLMKLRGGVEFTFTIPPEGSTVAPSGEAQIRQAAVGQPVVEVLAAHSFITQLAAAHRAEIWIGGQNRLSLCVGSLTSTSEPDGYTRQLVDDLAAISQFANVPLMLPDHLTWAQRREIRKCRLVIDGATILENDFAKLSAVLNGTADQALIDHLHAAALMVTVDTTVQFLVLGHKIGIAAKVFHPRAHVPDAPALLEALAAGTAEGRELTFVGTDGSPFRVFAPSRRHDEGPLVPEPLGIEGAPTEAG